MSLRPIDYQVTVNKAAEFHKDVHFIRSRPNVEQAQYSEKLQRKVVEDKKKTPSASKTEYNKIDKDNPNEKRNSKGNRGNEKSNQNEEDIDSNLDISFKIDIRV